VVSSPENEGGGNAIERYNLAQHGSDAALDASFAKGSGGGVEP
jgi:hypothetical protein